MKRILIAIIAATFLMLPASVFGAAAASCAITYGTEGDNISTVTWTWVADPATGAVTCAASTVLRGWVFLAETDPGATAPTALYDIALNNTLSTDVFGGALNDRSATVSEQTPPQIRTSAGVYGTRWVYGTLTPAFTNQSVNSATGKLKIYISRE